MHRANSSRVTRSAHLISTRAVTENIPVRAKLSSSRPRKDQQGFELISDVLPFGRLWYDTPDNAIGYAMHSSRSHDAVIHVYDSAGNVIGKHEHKGDFKEVVIFTRIASHCPLKRLRPCDRALLP